MNFLKIFHIFVNFPFSLKFENNVSFKFNNDFSKILEYNNLLSFKDWDSFDKGFVFRENKERLVKEIRLFDKNKNEYIFHLKKHNLFFKDFLKSIFLFKKILDGKNEWNMINLFLLHDIPTMTPVAYGEVNKFFFSYKTFTVTEHLYNTLRLEDYIPKYLNRNQNNNSFYYKMKVIKKLSFLVRKMHSLGFNHQDLYLGHFFINPNSFDLFIIDLQRVIKRKKIRFIDKIKDLGQLFYSASLFHEINLSDILRFLKLYLQHEKKFTKNDRFLMKLINYKKLKIQSHIPDVIKEKAKQF